MFDPGLMDMILRLRGRGVSQNSILRAIELIPRKYFVAEEHYLSAYDEVSLPIECGQTLSPPLTVARMIQALEVQPEHKVLEVGTGSGYQAALLSQLCKRLYTMDRYATLVEQSDRVFQKLDITNIVTRHGDGRHGWKGQAPFDRIIITAGVDEVPEKPLEQLAPRGRLVAVVKNQLMTFDKAKTRITQNVIFPMELPMWEKGKSKAL